MTDSLIKPGAQPGTQPGTPASRRHFTAAGTAALPTLPAKPHLEWTSRGYLPHFDHPGLVQFITFRLDDSVPRETVLRWKEELDLQSRSASSDSDSARAAELRERIAKYEDAGHGACFLRQPVIAALVENALLHFDGGRYHLLAWCVMPNHVHVLAEMKEGVPLSDIIHSWKSFTAKKANQLLRRTGDFWMREYHDRYIRNSRHLEETRSYIEENPVKAGLAKSPQDWPWSSALREKIQQASEQPSGQASGQASGQTSGQTSGNAGVPPAEHK